MATVGEAKIVISADDRTGSAFQSLERKVEGLGRATKSVGEAAGSIGRIAAEVDRVAPAVARSTEAVSRFSGALRTIDGVAGAMGQVVTSVERAAATMPRLTADAAAMARAMQGVAEAERMVATETDRIGRAGSKLALFKSLQGDFRAARATFGEARADLAGLARQLEANGAQVNALRQRRDIALAAEARARGAYEASPIPGRADAADKARFDALKAARAEAAGVMTAATKERRDIEAALGAADHGPAARKLGRDYADAQKATALAATALDGQKRVLIDTKREFEALAGPLGSVTEAERRLVAAAEAASSAFAAQGRAATEAAETAARALAREEAAFARAAEGRARWAREFQALEAQAGGQRGALAPGRRATAVEVLHGALRRPAAAPPHSAAAREAAALAAARLRLNAFREVQGTAAELRRAARAAQAEAARVGRDVRDSRAPSPELLAAHEQARGQASAATRAFEAQSGALKGLKAEIEGVLGPLHSLASAEAQLAGRADRAEAALKRQEAVHKRMHAVKGVAEDLLPFEGPEVLHLTREAIVEGAKVQHERVGLVDAGRTPEEIEAIEARSREVSGRLPTATPDENLKIVAETTGAFGSLEHALEHLQFMQQTMSILHTAAGDKIHEGPGEIGRYLAKFFEDRQTKPEDFQKEAKLVIPAMVATGGVFNPREMFMFAMQAKSSLPMYDQEFLSKYMPALIARSTGERQGTAANAFANTITGKARDAKQAKAWLDLGLLDPTKLTSGSKGPVGWSAGAVKGNDLALANPVRWAEEVLIPAMKAHGINTDDRTAVTNMLATMFRNTMANQFANEIGQAVSLHLLHKDADLYGRVGSDDDIYKRNLHEDPTVALDALGATIKSFAATVTSPVMKDVADVLGTTAEGLAHLGKSLGDFDTAHPELAKAIAGGAIGALGGTGLALTGMLYTNLKGLLSGAGQTAAAAEMVTAGGLQVEAGNLMLAAAGKNGLPGGGLPGGPGGVPAKEAEKDAPSLLRKALPVLGTAGPIAAAGAAVAGVILNRDQSKSLVDGGRPDVQPQDNNLGLPGLENDPDIPAAPAPHLRKGWWSYIRRRFGMAEAVGPPAPEVPLPPRRPADLPVSPPPAPPQPPGIPGIARRTIGAYLAFAQGEAAAGRMPRVLPPVPVPPVPVPPVPPRALPPVLSAPVQPVPVSPVPVPPVPVPAAPPRALPLVLPALVLPAPVSPAPVPAVPVPPRALPPVLPVPMPAVPPHALPPAPTGAPIPVHVVSTAANIPLSPMGPGMHRDFTLGNLSSVFASSGLGASNGFQPFPGHHAPAFESLPAAAVKPDVDLGALDAALGKTHETADALKALGAMAVAPQVNMAAIDALIAKLIQAKALIAGLGTAGGGTGTTGSTGPSRVVSDPGVGRSR